MEASMKEQYLDPPDYGYFTDDELDAIAAQEEREAEDRRQWLEPLEDSDPYWTGRACNV
jgi:hypothetical protein